MKDRHECSLSNRASASWVCNFMGGHNKLEYSIYKYISYINTVWTFYIYNIHKLWFNN